MQNCNVADMIKQSLRFMKEVLEIDLYNDSSNDEDILIYSNAYQPFLTVERLPAALYQECIKKGYIKLREFEGIVNPHPRFGVVDLKRDEQRRKEDILAKIRKARDKHHEKESKKEVVYWQKKLTKYVLKHKEAVDPYTDFLICARKNVKGLKVGKRKLTDLKGIKDVKVRKNIIKLYMNLLHAMEHGMVTCDQHREAKIDKKSINQTKFPINIKSSKLPSFNKYNFADFLKTPRNIPPSTPPTKAGAKLIFPPSKVILYGVEDLKRDELRKKEEIKEKVWKQKLLRKVLDKYHEKETKKEVLYRQKKLTKFALKYKEVVDPYTDFLICAHKNVKGLKDGKAKLKQLNSINNAKIRKYVKEFYMDLLYAMEEVPANKNRKVSRDQHNKSKTDEKKLGNLAEFPSITKSSGVSSFDESNCAAFQNTPLSDFVNDPFVDTKLITGDLHLLECICETPNCLGLHPEKFYCEVLGFDESNCADFQKTPLSDFVNDPFVDTKLITGDFHLIECICGKLNCLGLHPEKLY